MPQDVLDPDETIAKSPDAIQELLSWLHWLHANSSAFLSRLLALARNPRGFAPVIIDFGLLIQSIWTGRQLGPDFVYPMLGIRKRQSGRLASLILQHSKDERSYELRAETTFPKGITHPCVAVMDLDEVPRDVVENGYSTQADLHGVTCLLIFLWTIVALTVQMFLVQDKEWTYLLGTGYVLLDLALFIHTVLCGDGTLMLARRSDTSTRGCAVLLDQDFTVILNGNQSVVEAIAEGSFNLIHTNPVQGFRLRVEERNRVLLRAILEALCDTAFLTGLTLCCLLFCPQMESWLSPSLLVYSLTFLRSPQESTLSGSFRGFLFLLRTFPSDCIILLRERQDDDMTDTQFSSVTFWLSFANILALLLLALFSTVSRAQNYPIRSEKFLDVLGNPQVKKWEFDTLAAAATFQCLVLCRGIARPVRSIDVLAYLDMLVPDQRDLWTAWKARVADRIVHEMDINFAPTIPTFGDERQQGLKDLLDQAQFGYRTYMRFYA